jgi:hypothetical protein
MKNALSYNREWLARGSHAYDLHQAGEHKKLKEHMKLLDQQYLARHGRLPEKGH